MITFSYNEIFFNFYYFKIKIFILLKLLLHLNKQIFFYFRLYIYVNVFSMNLTSGSTVDIIPNLDSINTESQLKILCLVCNDISTGYHYGTPSCNGWYYIFFKI